MNSAKTPNPYVVLLAGIVPGAGHVVLGLAQRGMIWLYFTIILGWLSLRLMPETMSFMGRHIGGVFIWGLSMLDAYKIARIRAQKDNSAD
jgi:hypothetical protein